LNGLLVSKGDEVSGLSVSIRERDDLIQIWNKNSRLSDQSKIVPYVKKLISGVQFYTVFYTGKVASVHLFKFSMLTSKDEVSLSNVINCL
jgi:hypothetical protein